MNRLAKAVQKLNEIWGELPKRASWVRGDLMEVKNLLLYAEEEAKVTAKFTFVELFRSFLEEVEFIINSIERDYNEREEIDAIRQVDEIGHRIDKLRIKMNAFLEYAGIKDVLVPTLEFITQQMEKFSKKISAIYPDRNAFKEAVETLQEEILSTTVLNDLKEALEQFNQGNYAAAIWKCGLAAERLTDIFCLRYLRPLGIEIEQPRWWGKLDAIWKGLDHSLDTTGKPLGKKGRLEWYLLFLLLCNYWLRNTADHPQNMESEENLPEWMKEYREELVRRTEHARIAMLCTLQASSLLQNLLEISKDARVPPGDGQQGGVG